MFSLDGRCLYGVVDMHRCCSVRRTSKHLLLMDWLQLAEGGNEDQDAPKYSRVSEHLHTLLMLPPVASAFCVPPT